MSGFNGFSEELIRFFVGLETHNDKDWFQKHKKDYEAYVKAPSQAFVMTMGERLREISPNINAIPKVNQSLFRINRDTRFSRDKLPYKTHMGIWFWEGGRKKRMECSGFYFHLSGENFMIGAGIHAFPPSLLKGYRNAVADEKLGPKLTDAVNKVSEKGYVIGRKHYKRTPRGFDPNHKRADFLLYNGLTAMTERTLPEEFFSSAIIDVTFSHFKNMAPIHRWLVSALG